MIRRSMILIALAGLVAHGLGCSSNGLSPGNALPPLQVQGWIQGTAPTADEFRGNVVVINFFATWCAPCTADLPELVEVFERYRDRGVIFLSLTDEEVAELDTITQYAQQLGIPWLVGYGAAPTMETFQVRERPITFVIARNGTITWHSHQVGTLDGAIRQVL